MGHDAMALDAAVDVSSSKQPPVPPPSPPRIDSWARGGRRSKSKRRAGSPAASSDGGSSGGGADVDNDEQEYLAVCLLMLSRGLRGAGADGAAEAKRAGAANKAGAYECSVCGKVYASYQALGGHKTSHRKPPTPPVAAAVVAPAPGDEALSGSGGTAAHAEEKEKVHQCTLCLRTFPSGQALGGHKRLHYEGVVGDGAKDKDKDAAAKTKKDVAATVVLRDFDLNLPADEAAPPEAKRARTMLLVV